MSFLWPEYLWLTAALPLLPVMYVWLLGRRRKSILRYTRVAAARDAGDAGWKRHVPPLLLFLACAVLVFAASRPVAPLRVPWARSTVMLAIDVSLSMRVADVKPTRMAAAQDAAKVFLRSLPNDVEVGLVTFAGSSQVAQRATLDRDVLVKAIDNFQMQLGTAVGDAIAQCVAELFPDHGIDVGDMTLGEKYGRSIDAKDRPAPKKITPVAPGSYRSAAIILLSDGRRTTGIDTLKAAKLAAERGVRIYAVGLGTVDGAMQLPEGMAVYLQLDEPTLREVARMTGGEYLHAGTAEKLRMVYENLGSRLEVQSRDTELTGALALVSAALMLAAGVLSLVWFRRLA